VTTQSCGYMARFQEDEQVYSLVFRPEKPCENNVFVEILLAVAAKPHTSAGLGAGCDGHRWIDDSRRREGRS